MARVKTVVAEVREASQQQAQGIDQVLQSIQQIERVTQTTAATAAQNASAGDGLNAQAAASMAVVRQLEALVDGTNALETQKVSDLGGVLAANQ